MTHYNYYYANRGVCKLSFTILLVVVLLAGHRLLVLVLLLLANRAVTIPNPFERYLITGAHRERKGAAVVVSVGG